MDLIRKIGCLELGMDALAALDNEPLDATFAEVVQDSAEVDLVLVAGHDDVNLVKVLDGRFLIGLSAARAVHDVVARGGEDS